MNQEQVNEYVHKHDGGICPFCGSLDIEIVDCSETLNRVHCNGCGDDWFEIMQLVGIVYNGKEYLAEKK